MTKILESGKESPFEKKEKSERVEFRDREGSWGATQAEVRSSAVIDPGFGQDVVIRNFVVYPKPSSQKNPKYGIISAEETLKGLLPMIKANVIKDGWTFLREPTIRKFGKGFIITTVLRPAIKHGTIIGATNAKAKNASELLKEANLKNKNIKI